MAKRLTRDERKERLTENLNKAKNLLNDYEADLAALDQKREALAAKIKDKKATVEKYEDLLKETKYNVLDEILRLKGVDVDEISIAIANGDIETLMALANRKAGGQEADSGGLESVSAAPEPEADADAADNPEEITAAGPPEQMGLNADNALRADAAGDTSAEPAVFYPRQTADNPVRHDSAAVPAQAPGSITIMDYGTRARPSECQSPQP